LQPTQVHPGVEQVTGEGMAQHVGMDGLAEVGAHACLLTEHIDGFP
jgi:hypothetical protein